jgi:hypothetical protein
MAPAAGAAAQPALPVSFDEVREKNLEQLKLLNNVVFPIKFPVRASSDEH